MTSNKKEVCLDFSQGVQPLVTSCARGTSVTKSTTVVSSREAFFTQKSSSFDLVDACTQADISCDVITYDSDDEMAKSRREIPFGGLRNKKGHPIYSREDIREQYCITRKELEVLEHNLHDSSATRLFGCLSTSHLPDSHCNKNSFLLLSCVQRRKNSSEIDEEFISGIKALDYPKLANLKKDTIDDEDSSDGGFKQRISSSRSITRTVKSIENSSNANINLQSRQSSQYQRPKFEKTSNSFDSQSPLKRPTNLYFGDNRESSQLNTTTSHSVDELNDRQRDWRSSRVAKTPDLLDDSRHNIKKHVTFANTHLVRSATVGGINNIHSTSTTPMSERLLNEKIQMNGPLVRKTDSNESFDVKSTTSSTIYGYIPMYRVVRRAVMKTQATQTDTSSKRRICTKSIRRSIPAYLTLSPRASKQMLNKDMDKSDMDMDSESPIKTTSAFGKSESLHGICIPDDDTDDDEEVLQISIKEKKLRKFNKTKSIDLTKIKRRKVRTTKTSLKVSQEIDISTNLSEIAFQRLESTQQSSQSFMKEELQSKSSTDSSQLKSESDLNSSATNDLESSFHSLQSQDSSTIVSELNSSLISNEDKQQLIDEIIDDYFDASDVTKRPLIIDPKRAIMKNSESFTSPDSDNYSFTGEQNKASIKNEISPQNSSSPPVDNIDSGGSSVYVTATDNSPKVEKDITSGQTSFETASSGSRFSSPPETEQTKSDVELNSPENNDNIASHHKPTLKQSPKPKSPIKQIRTYINIETKKDSSSESSNVCSDRALSPESIASTHYSTEHNIEDFDSEDVGDITPVQDLSTDTSTAIETPTVIENVVKPTLKPKIPPKPTFLLGDQKISINTEKSLIDKHLSVAKVEEEASTAFLSNDDVEQSDDNEDIVDDISGGEFICRRNMSGELSTVSEVSEEISANGKSNKSDSGSGILILKTDANKKLNDTGAIRSNASSFAESTTSGSFMIDGNITEPTSLTESLEKQTIEKSESFPCLSGENLNKAFPIDSITDQTSAEDIKEEINDKAEGPAVVELSQDTDKDLENTEFSLQQMSIDEESVSQEAALQSYQSTSVSLIDYEKNDDSIVVVNDNQQSVQISPSPKKQMDTSGISPSPKKQMDTSVRRRRDNFMKSLTTSESSEISRPVFTSEEWKAIVQRRSRSLSKSPDKWMAPMNDMPHSCGHYHFTCRQCGEKSEQKVPSLFIKRGSLPFPYLKPTDSTYHNNIEDDEDIGIHSESYRSALWVYVGYKDELIVWGHKCQKRNSNSNNGESTSKLIRSESEESTMSERQFRRQYESVTHRMIHRRASIEMYKRAITKTFAIEKEIIIHRINGEFGFRIHGSRPVVVSAIEKNTPAETCGLDVGDIVITINGHNVLDSSHSEVVKLAHSGSETLKLEVVSTKNELKYDNQSESDGCDVVINGYLTKFSHNGTKKLRKNRWFMLKTDNCLYWYKSTKEMEDPLGVICLQGYTASCVPEIAQSEPFAFRLVRFGAEVKYFAAKDKDTVNQWINSINLVSNKLNKADPYVDTALQNLHRNPSTIANCDCCGHLAIFSQRRKVWRNRYFVLKDASLYFYLDSNSNSALGVFFLHGYRVQSCILIGKKNTFETIPSESKFRHLWLMAESDIDKKRWLAALEYSIDRWIRL